MNSFAQWQGDNLILTCHLQPRASRTESVGLHGEALKIRIKASPVEGKANTELIRFLAEEFAVPKRQVTIISGEQSRHKRVCIEQPNKAPEFLILLPDT